MQNLQCLRSYPSADTKRLHVCTCSKPTHVLHSAFSLSSLHKRPRNQATTQKVAKRRIVIEASRGKASAAVATKKSKGPKVPELDGISVTMVGDNSEANAALAQLLAGRLPFYTPLQTSKVIEQVYKCTSEELVASEGEAMLGAVEAATLETLSTNIRLCVATLGGGCGGAARGDCWRHLYGSITVWIDDSWKDSPDAPQREAYSQADIRLQVDTGGKELSVAEVAESLLVQVIAALHDLIKNDPKLCGKKALYMKMGCRGDWPFMQPPEWNPDAPAPQT